MASTHRETYSIFIPVYNEEKRLEENVRRAYAELERLGVEYRLYIVDDSSRDNTGKIGKRLELELDNLTYLYMPDGPSRRENLVKAFFLGKGRYIAFFDLDLSTDLKHLDELLTRIRGDADVVTGSRYLPGSELERKVNRRIISFFFNLGIRILFGTRIRDHECGFKAWKRPVIEELVEVLGYDTTGDRGVFWDTEMLIRARQKGLTIQEFPVRWIEGETSALNVAREKRMIGYVIRFWFRYHGGL